MQYVVVKGRNGLTFVTAVDTGAQRLLQIPDSMQREGL